MSAERDDPDDLDRLIADHAVRADVDAVAARRIRMRAHEELRARPRAWLAWLEPALALAVGSAQLVWAMHVVLAVYR